MYPDLRKSDGSYYRVGRHHESMLHVPMLLTGERSTDGQMTWNSELSRELESQAIERLRLQNIYDGVSGFGYGRGEGFIQVRRLTQFGLYNYLGQKLLEPKWDEIRIQSHYAHVRKGILFGVMNLSGEWVLPPRYHMIRGWQNGFFEVGMNVKQNPSGIDICLDLEWNGILGPIYMSYWGGLRRAISEGTPIHLNGRWGVFDEYGVEVLPIVYEDLVLFDGDRAVVLKDGCFGVIDLRGNIIVPCEWELVGVSDSGPSFGNRGEKKWWRVDRENRLRRTRPCNFLEKILPAPEESTAFIRRRLSEPFVPRKYEKNPEQGADQ